MAVGWAIGSHDALIVPDAPAYWSTVQIQSDPTATPASPDQRQCNTPDSLYPMGNGQWYDVCTFHNRVYVSVLASNHTLLHGPSDIGESYPSCKSGVLNSHDLVMFCRYYGDLNSAPSPLTLHVVDLVGRPHTSIKISGQADYSALAVDSSGGLHVAWLDPQPGSIWTVHYASYSGDSAVLDSGTTLPPDNIIGVIHLAPDHLLLNFALGIDAHTVYVIWDDSTAPYGTDSNYPGIVYALTFPLDKPNTTQQVTLAENMQDWSAMPLIAINDHTLALALVVAPNDNAPVVAFLINGKTARIDVFSSPLAELFRGPFLSLDADGSLHIQWSVWTANQAVITYGASTNRFP